LADARAHADPFESGVPLPAAMIGKPADPAAVPRVIICLPDIERILTNLRRFAFLRATATDPVSIAAQPLSRLFLCALASASYLVESAWIIEPDEGDRLANLRARLQAILVDTTCNPAHAEDALLLAALYGSLCDLPDAERLAAVPEARWSAEFAPVVREQVLEPFEERGIASRLPTLTPITDPTSQAVREMYEVNPYPRWRAAPAVAAEPLIGCFRWLCPGEDEPDWPTPLPVLVAGAGTGQHPIRTALRLPDADVLAIDLSLGSLAYGARMARRIGVRNVRFAQADILALDALDERFALVECVGVLHHLSDPLAGWAVLRRRLRPDGLMMIAIYSECARVAIIAARELLRQEGAAATPDGIRAARRRLLDLPPRHPAASVGRFWDFYSASGFRDLTMHVQEHRFTIPWLAEALDVLDLRFLRFLVSPAVQKRFCARFPETEADRDLACWDAFEADEPATFASMYQFWCRPR
jgi:SAM-dependent methyltransferase